MPKPTLLQTILGKPSQTYHHPAERDYHSTKDELFRIANATRVLPGHFSCSDSGFDSSTPANSDSEQQPRLSHLQTAPALARPPSLSAVSSDGASGSLGSSQLTPTSRRSAARKRSLIHSIASSSSFVSFKNANTDGDRLAAYSQPTHSRSPSSSATTSARQSRSSRTYTPSSRGNEGDAEDSTEDDDEDGTDVFYTPRSSFVSSPRMSRTSTAVAMLEPQALASALLPLHSKSSATPLATVPDGGADSTSVSRTPSGSSISSVASSTSGGDGSPSVFSSPTQTASTQITTPANSERGTQRVEAVTIASSSRARPTSSGAKSVSSSSTRSSTSSSTVRKRSREEARKLTYTDEDWAQDVRWLTPPKMPAASGSSGSSRRHHRILPPDFQLPPPLEQGGPSSFAAPPARRPGGSRSKGDRRSRRSRHSRGRMSALWEEDESEECSTGVSSSEPSRASTPMLDTPPHSLPPSPLAKATTLPPELQDDSPPSESTHESTPDARLQKYARGQRQSLSTAGSYFRPGGPASADLPTHPLPTPFPASSSSTSNGYTGLVLPHAGYSNAKGKTTAEGHVDLVRAGVAQTSMCTIEVIRGVAQTISHGVSPLGVASSGSPAKPRRSFSISLGRSFSLSLRPRRRESATPVHLQGSLPLPVAFTAHVAPPTYVPESHVLVQVHAVGLDSLDSLIVHEKSGASVNGAGGKGIGGGKAGFIPGRSFVGKVVECGWAVSAEVCRRGEWVVGLLDVKKCGALAEFILVERHRVHRAPQPRARTISLFPPRRRSHLRSSSLPANANGSATPFAPSPLAPPPLTIEELALLPLCGVPAHRAIRTFADVLAPPVNRSYREDEKPAVRALVLQGHDGAGALAVQMLGRRGVRICVQIPESAVYDPHEPDPPRKPSIDTTRSSPSKTKDKGKGRAGVAPPPPSRREQVEARLRAWGAEDVCVGEPLDVLRRLAEDGQSFDAVLDTVGGVAVWEAAQKLLTMDWTASAARSSLSLASRSDIRPNGHSHSQPHTDGENGYSSSGGGQGLGQGGNYRPSKLKSKLVSHAQFTTLVGDTPQRAIPTAQDNLRSGLRSLRRSVSTSSPASPSPASHASLGRSAGGVKTKRVVGYAWVSVAADVDFEGEDVRDSLGAVVRMAEGGWLRPWVGGSTSTATSGSTPNGSANGSAGAGAEEGKVVPFERAPEVFRRGVVGPLGVLADGGTCAVRIVE